MSRSLTVGMAVYREFESVWATIQGLRANHGDGFDLVVVDNAPERDPRMGAATRAAGGAYYHRPDLAGTSKPRDACFHFARTPWVLVCDSHVVFETDAIRAAVEYAAAHPNSADIVSGPVVGDDGVWTATHWAPDAPPGLWGSWAVHPAVADRWNPQAVAAAGAAGVRRAADAVPPFEIPMMGLGCFMMRREAWPGFNPLFRGFGGEEGYVHEKVRRLGGRAVCLPRLRWRHRFRDLVDWTFSPQPYPSSSEDHVWNMIVGHLELGIDPTVIRDRFGKKVSPETWATLEAEARRRQPLGTLTARPPRQRVLGVWYTNNAAPHKVLAGSLRTIRAAATQSRHAVTVVTCPWRPVPGNPFPEVLADLGGVTGHAAIVRQITQCLDLGGGEAAGFDAVAFLEHDVLYPPDYFDRVGDALAADPTARVVVNLDYEGMNATGYLAVRERHEPLHQITMRWAAAVANLRRAGAEAAASGQCILEPDSLPAGGPADRSGWVRLPALGLAPAVHVNHPKRLTSHGEVVFRPDAGGRTSHPFWGPHTDWWDGPVDPAAAQPAAPAGRESCQPCAAAAARRAQAEAERRAMPPPATAGEWADRAAASPSDFHTHVPTLRALADQVERAAEISVWDDKAGLAALVAGRAGEVVSYGPAGKRVWREAARLAPGRFRSAPIPAGPVPETDLLFVDTAHTAQAVYALLATHAPAVTRYLVVHCTETFGVTGDDGTPGVMAGIRRFLMENREWTVIRQDKANHGLVVMSRDPRDKETPPGLLRKALNFSMALAEHAKDGNRLVDRPVWELRMAACLTCPHRVHDVCAKCGCPVDKKASWASSECPDDPKRWERDA